MQVIAEILTKHKQARVFMASNDAAVKAQVSTLFPGRVVTLELSQGELASLGCQTGSTVIGDREST